MLGVAGRKFKNASVFDDLADKGVRKAEVVDMVVLELVEVGVLGLLLDDYWVDFAGVELAGSREVDLSQQGSQGRLLARVP